MSSSPLYEQDVRELVRILGEVAAMPPDPPRQREYLMNQLSALLGTDTWVWGAAPLLEPGKQPVYLYQHTGGFDEERMARYLLAVEHPDCGEMTAPLARALQAANGQVTRRIEQIVSVERFAGSPAKPLWDAADIGPILITLHPVAGYGISCIGFYRPRGAPAFSERDSRIAHILLGEVPLLHVAGMPHATAREIPRLPPRCRLILNLLVRGIPRKSIASELGLSPGTVHGYTRIIFGHFGVHSQAELIARFSEGDGRDDGAES
ncbi:MAG TPA: LuxR C-terminal-related transcriptional regulator, partial [Luteolibacter sp.]